MREVILGTAGHVDHGKTSLVRALTGIETDRLKEEKKRGITIELGFAFLDLPCGHRLGIIDVPGHEKFIKNMVAGAAGVDLVAFVIAADEGIMPQTREHFEICSLLGVKRGVIIITKKDMVDAEWLELVQEEVREFFADSFLADAPMLTVSATTGDGINKVEDVLDQLVAASTFAEMHGPFRLPVDRVFSMKGFGAVITGTSLSGRIGVGDEVMFYPAEIGGRIRGIQVHGTDVEEVEAGKRTAINVQGLEKEAIARGDMLASPGCLEATYMLDADFLYLSSNKKNLKNRSRVRVHIGSAEIMGRIVILAEEELLPGSQADVQILLESPLAIWPGDRYVIRSYSPVATIGGGEIFSASSAKRRRFKPVNKEIFAVYRQGGPEELAIFHVRESHIKGLCAAELAVKMGVFGKKLKKILALPISQRKVLVIESDIQRLLELGVYGGVVDKCLLMLTSFHQDNPLKEGMPKEELRSSLYGGLDVKLFQYMLNDLARKQELVEEDGVIRRFAHKVSLQADTRKLRGDIEAFYLAAGIKTPTIKELFQQFAPFTAEQIKEILDILVRDKVMVKISEELYFHQTSLAKLEADLIAFIKNAGEIDAQGFKGMTGLSRKFSIPLLEYFDRKKITLRLADKRVLRRG